MSPQAEHLSPFVEGFENETMQTLFTEMLKVKSSSKVSSAKRTKKAISARAADGTCAPVSSASNGNSPGNPSSLFNNSDDKVAFLKSVIKQQRETVDSLMASSKKINPVAQKIKTIDTAYDSAFETDITSPLPTMSSTLQGFTIFFFTLSYFSLAIVVCIMLNNQTGSTSNALKLFAALFMAFFILVNLIPRIV